MDFWYHIGILLIAGLVLLTVLSGLYLAITHVSFNESFYICVSTLTTVGHERTPRSDGERLYLSVLSILGHVIIYIALIHIFSL